MRCIQTADSVLDGMDQRLNIPIRADLALHEPTSKHLPLQSPEYYYNNGYNMDLIYRSMIPIEDSAKIMKENRLVYYRRMYTVLKRIIARLSVQKGGETILIVTHRPCVTILAAMLNIDNVENKQAYLHEMENKKRAEVNFLSMVIAEYDPQGKQWIYLADFPDKQKQQRIVTIPVHIRSIPTKRQLDSSKRHRQHLV